MPDYKPNYGIARVSTAGQGDPGIKPLLVG